MRGWRVYPAFCLLAALALSGCGSSPEGPSLAPAAEPRAFDVRWVERHAGFTYRVDRLVVEEEGWRVTFSITNRSRLPYRVDSRSVGLVLLDSATQAELRRLTGNLTHPPPALKPDGVAAPPPPPALGPGASWSATVSGSEVLREGSVVRVLFGPFTSIERFRTEVQDVFWVTDHYVRL
jgi:hypothetical protein